MGARLPIFPLTTVLVPGLVLPLHIFEPRYRELIQRLMALPEGAARQFGVIAVRTGAQNGDRPGDLHTVGCTAELREVTPYADGRFDIVSVGETRFRLTGIDTEAGTPYHTGIVEFLPETDGDGDLERLAARVTHLFAEYRRTLGVEVTPLPDDPQVVSYLVAAAVVLHLPQRQALLEQPTTSDRLRAERELLRREVALVRAFRSLPAVELMKGPVNAN
ncbi:MAG TPA: LON peptidase substrate-binding domain-containing protein [Kineosporiaceae bacterium]